VDSFLSGWLSVSLSSGTFWVEERNGSLEARPSLSLPESIRDEECTSIDCGDGLTVIATGESTRLG